MGETIEFNLQGYLEHQFDKVDKRFDAVESKMDEAVKAQTEITTRLADVEHTHKTLKFLGGAFIVGLIGMIFDGLTNHLPALLHRWFE